MSSTLCDGDRGGGGGVGRRKSEGGMEEEEEVEKNLVEGFEGGEGRCERESDVAGRR